MANDFEDLYDIENMNDYELKELVLQELHEYPEIDVDLIEVSARNGTVTVSGRVGTEQEAQQVEHVLTDVLGLSSVVNDLVIDEVVRGQRSEAADEEWVEESVGNPQRTQGTIRTSDEAEHLTENLEAEQYGTDDPQEATERGTAYEPPVRPVQEGSTREQH
jgi:hypothetical protein